MDGCEMKELHRRSGTRMISRYKVVKSGKVPKIPRTHGSTVGTQPALFLMTRAEKAGATYAKPSPDPLAHPVLGRFLP